MIQPGHFRPDLHEAKDLKGLLDRLDPADRIRWLRLVCLKVSAGQPARVDVIASTGETREILADFYTLASNHSGLLEWATVGAEYLVTKRDVREAMARPLQGG